MRSPCSPRFPLSVTRQRLGKDVPAATNTHAKIGEVLDMSYQMLNMQ
jgi:hypothetical protein